MVKEVNTFDELLKLLQSTSIVIIDFYATWCGPCKMISPHFAKIAEKYADRTDVVFVKVDVDKVQEADVEAMPTFRVYKGVQLIDQIQGAPPPKQLEMWVASHIPKAS